MILNTKRGFVSAILLVVAFIFTSNVAYAIYDPDAPTPEGDVAATKIMLTSEPEVTTQSDVDTIATLTAQIQALLEQIAVMQEQLNQVQKQVVELKIAFNSSLYKGVENEEVKQLQEVLSKDKEVYPEGLVTGYYGTLTEKAVIKFQEKHGIEKAGVVGPKTRAKLNELYGEEDYKKEYEKKEYDKKTEVSYENKKKEEYYEEKKKEEYIEEKKKEVYVEEVKEDKSAYIAPGVSISVSPAVVGSGSSAEIKWESTGSNICYAHEGNWEGVLEGSGSRKIENIEETSTFTVKCKNDYGKTIQSATVIVESSSE